MQSEAAAATPSKKISASSARAHTRTNRSRRPSSISAMFFVPVAVALTVGALGWVYQNLLRVPNPRICGSPGGPPITSPRVKLDDGRHLAYKETGVSKEVAKHKIIIIHGFDDSKDLRLPISQELMEELSIYVLTFDRAGYGESDPNPSRSVKSEAHDIEELADKLQIGSKFHVIGISMGGYPAYSCLKYIPHRLAGVALVAPFVHYWWPCLPADLSKLGLQKLLPMDRRTFYVAHYAPWMFHWWMSQKWFPSLSMMAGNEKIRQQGIHESLHRDILAGYAKWEFDPMDLTNPFPNNEGSVHIWQGSEDRIIPREINRYLAEKIPWIRYHEVEDVGHLFITKEEHLETVLRALVQTF
ncbi:Lipase 1 [Linum perenne]